MGPKKITSLLMLG